MPRSLIVFWFLVALSDFFPAGLLSYSNWSKRDQPGLDYLIAVALAVAFAGVGVESLSSLIGALWVGSRQVPLGDFIIPLTGRTLKAASIWFVMVCVFKAGKHKVKGQAV